ncbi:hypothetical protein GLS40_05095 [Pseudooceanicola sp. 216_PA32_1]|uniref:Uncharacterized protein n=1 Tax=Pseudooceanicola pacificus TaxID=2676438 RepID=A0A844W981_9RHOB|nr:hypothetical protein [Pseudooceanicola pacificus]MWB77393.1 hypothetical protein [Pseudooceanicola pacificus]
MQTRNEEAIRDLIDQLDSNIRTCEAFLRQSRWSVVEDALRTRRRATATLRAILRWYGAGPYRASPTWSPDSVGIADIVTANRLLVAAYDRARDIAADDAPEARLLDEQRAALLANRSEIAWFLTGDTARHAPDDTAEAAAPYRTAAE